MTDCLFLVPIILPFYQQHIGLGYKELMLGEGALAASCILFDVPTGWISDVWQRKYTLILGAAVEAAGIAVYLIAHHLWQIIVAQMVAGIGISLLNGTHTALLYDSLLALDREGDYRRLEGRRQGLTLYAGAFAGALGGLLYSANNYLPIYLSIAAQLVAIGTACFMQEPPKGKPRDRSHPIRDIAATVTHVLRAACCSARRGS